MRKKIVKKGNNAQKSDIKDFDIRYSIRIPIWVISIYEMDHEMAQIPSVSLICLQTAKQANPYKVQETEHNQ